MFQYSLTSPFLFSPSIPLLPSCLLYTCFYVCFSLSIEHRRGTGQGTLVNLPTCIYIHMTYEHVFLRITPLGYISDFVVFSSSSKFSHSSSDSFSFFNTLNLSNHLSFIHFNVQSIASSQQNFLILTSLLSQKPGFTMQYKQQTY